MYKNWITILLLLLTGLFVVGCSSEGGAIEEKSPDTEEKGRLMMATTTSTADTGLLDFLAPMFNETTGYTLLWTAVGTGEALKMGEDGEVDLVLVHAKSSEEAFVAGGYGVQRFPVMYNDFVVAGPKEPIAHTEDIAAVFTRIMEEELPFISRGDDSGTHKKEKAIWEKMGMDPRRNPQYVETGQGMGATLTVADEKKGYCLIDRGTYLKQKKDATLGLELEVICEGAMDLWNQYGIIAVHPQKHPGVNSAGANAFIQWICSKEGQEAIGGFGVDEYGQALFIPNAGEDR